MARKVKFPLKMADGSEVRTLDQLKEHFDVESVVGYFSDGRLLMWLQSRYYDPEAEKVAELDKNDPQLHKKLCAIFGVELEVEEIDPEEIARRQERLNLLKQYTYDKDILERVDLVAFDQEELSDLLDEEKPLIYLCNNRFTIPLRETHKTYIGVGKAIAVIRSNKLVDFDALHIEFKNVLFDDDYQKILDAQNKERELNERKRREAETAMRPKQLFEEGDAAAGRGDYEVALEKFKESANLGYPTAFSALGLMYMFGEGVDENIDEARRWLKLGMDKDDGDSFGWYAISLDSDNITASEKREAFKCMKRATELKANEGYWWRNLAEMYRYGIGTRENVEAAIRCYEKGVEIGDSEAANSLGVIYGSGEHVEKNPRKAFELIKQAVEFDEDNIQAVKNLGYHYRRGVGVDKNSSKAFEFYLRAAKAGDADAMCTVGYMLFMGEGVAKDDHDAFSWTKKAAEAGDVQGMKNVAYGYLKGNGTGRDVNKAIEYYTKAADAGDIDALVEIGNIYRDENDYYRAAAYFKQAAEQGNGAAMNQLALMYDNGQGVAQDRKLAAQWYRKAAEAGDADGMSNLSLCYLWGEGVSQDMNSAEYWMNQAAEHGNYHATLMYANYIFSRSKFDSRLAKLYESAANAGYGEAAYRLAVMYSRGYGTNRTADSADYWRKKYREMDYTPDPRVNEELNNAFSSGSSSSNSSGGGGCFITTAVCDSFGKPDDCFELTTFRKFRDGWLTSQPDGKALIAEYYAIAPCIVDKINSLADSAQVYKSIWREYLEPCLTFIGRGDNQSCKRLYVDMVTSLKEKFLKG